MAQPNPVQTFLVEAEDLLTQIEEIALDADPQNSDPEAINRLFRAFHTIKGSGAMFGFDAVAAFTHHVETALDKVREGAVSLSEELLDLVLASKDQIKALLESARGGAEVEPGKGEGIIASLNRIVGVKSSTPSSPASSPTAASAANQASQPPTASKIFRIRFRPDPTVIASGTNPLALLNELRALGECKVVGKVDAIPHLEELTPDQCFVWWDIELKGQVAENAIRDVFIFVQDTSEVVVTSEASPAASPTPDVNKVATSRPATDSEATRPASGSSSATEVKSAPSSANRGTQALSKKNIAKDTTIRVPSEKLDRLVNLVGELVMNQSRLTEVSTRLDATELAVPVEEIERLVAELRDNVLGIRMMPIGTTFSRFKRLVHDLSAELGKEIELVTEGAETELDKTVLDQLGDPLVHLIRNSIDHGIETAEKRVEQGKTKRGTIRLTAAHTGSNVVVSIQDDGKGLDTDAIRQKAVEKKLIEADAAMSDKEIFNLIFLPGFSTAKQVTSVSGRGVGMDVVKRQIDALRGSVAIQSTVGKGTLISLTLPLTLAIIDGLLVEAGGEQYIVPMSLVTENVELHRWERERNNGRNVVAVRGELISYLRLREVFGVQEPLPEIEKIVILRFEDQRVGLVVDRVLGSHQTVIQSLGRFYRNIEAFSGATIMGDGRVSLILDLAGLIQYDRTRPGGRTLQNVGDFRSGLSRTSEPLVTA